jgi:serine/threonine protein kinase
VAAPPGYEILGELGRGGMGVVYKARDIALNRLVALKMILIGGHASEQMRARFRKEAEALAQLRHPHIVPIYAWGEHQGLPYFALEFVAGGSLAERVQQQPQTIPDAVRLLIVLAEAMQAAHEKGIIHRDLKPANILLDPTIKMAALNTAYGCPKINDFGLVKHLQNSSDEATPSGAIMGTPSYMAPEQADGLPEQIGPATDVYALGAILYKLLAGPPPFQGTSHFNTIVQVLHERPKPLRELRPEIPPELEAICLKCLQKQPARRYPTAAALATALQDFLSNSPQPTVPVKGNIPQPAKPSRAWKPWHALAGVAVVALAVLPLVWFAGRETQPPLGSTPTALPTPPTQEPFKGWIDIVVTRPKDEYIQGKRLSYPRVIPLRAGDEINVQMELSRPGYVYILWIDTQGEVLPVYPWEGGQWEKWPARETPVTKLSLPKEGFWEMQPGPKGMETLVLFVSDTPLSAQHLNLRPLLGTLGPMTWNSDEAMWFENGTIVKNELDRAPKLDETKLSSNPAQRTQQLLHKKLGHLFTYTRAVSFTNLGSQK